MTDDTLRHYLLGTLPEAEAQELEERMLDDEDLFQTLRSVEDDLFDDFARGKLEERARMAFEQRYRGQRSRVTFAQALARRATNVVALTRPARSRRWWIGLAAAATLAIVVASILVTRVETIDPVTRPPIARRNVPPTSAFPVVLALTASRSSEAPIAITIPSGVETIQFRVSLDPEDRFESYQTELRSASGVVWRRETLKAVSVGEDLTLSTDVPARLVPAGSYELAVRGDSEALGFVVLEVRR